MLRVIVVATIIVSRTCKVIRSAQRLLLLLHAELSELLLEPHNSGMLLRLLLPQESLRPIYWMMCRAIHCREHHGRCRSCRIVMVVLVMNIVHVVVAHSAIFGIAQFIPNVGGLCAAIAVVQSGRMMSSRTRRLMHAYPNNHKLTTAGATLCKRTTAVLAAIVCTAAGVLGRQ